MTDHTKHGKAPASSTVHNPRRVRGAHATAVTFSVWGHQPSAVDCATGGGRDDLPYIAVRVGECLTYVYDRRALLSYLRVWEKAAAYNNEKLRLPATAATASAHQPGQDFAIACNVTGWQRSTVEEETSATGARRLRVSVGSVHIRVYASEGLRSHLAAWTRAADLAAVFDGQGRRRR